jgi:zinc transporter ZupT
VVCPMLGMLLARDNTYLSSVVSFVRCKKRHAPTHVEIVSGLVVGTLAAASTTISAVSTSRDGPVESATGSSTIRRVKVIERDAAFSPTLVPI